LTTTEYSTSVSGVRGIAFGWADADDPRRE
jgi:hypothetical protein